MTNTILRAVEIFLVVALMVSIMFLMFGYALSGPVVYFDSETKAPIAVEEKGEMTFSPVSLPETYHTVWVAPGWTGDR